MKLRPSLCPLAGVPGSPQNLAAEWNTWENDESFSHLLVRILHKETKGGRLNLANNGARNIYGQTGFGSEAPGLSEWKEMSSARNCPRD